MTFDIHVPNDFVRFVVEHGLRNSAGKPEVFRYDVMSSRHYNDEKVEHVLYDAPVLVHGKVYSADLSTRPDAPFGWKLGATRITQNFDNKRDLIDELVSLNANPEDVKKLRSMKTSVLQETIDNSPTDETDIVEITNRKQRTKTADLVYKVDAPEIKEVVVTIVSERGSRLEYQVSASWKHVWDKRFAEVEAALKESGFVVYRGRMQGNE